MSKELTPKELEALERTHPAVFEKLRPRENKRSPRWSEGTNPPYYTARFAAEVKPIIDKLLLDDSAKIIIDKKEFPNVKRQTAALKLKQGYLYLIDHMDNNGAYKSLEKLLQFKACAEGVEIFLELNILKKDKTKKYEFKEVKKDTPLPATQSVASSWRSKLEEFLDDPSIHEYHINGVLLSPEDMEYAQELLQHIPSCQFDIGDNYITAKRIVE